MISKKIIDFENLDKEAPFKDCVFGREDYAKSLTEYILRFEQGKVLLLNGKYGMGKTTFLKMWENYLKVRDFLTIYYDAWENDYITDPLLGIGHSTFKSFSPNSNPKLKLKLKIEKLSKYFIKKFVKEKTGIDINEIYEKCTQEIKESFFDITNTYQNKTHLLETFKKDIDDAINNFKSTKPILFIIDELDRCNPIYAVKVLEIIKHLFNNPNIIFIISADKKQLVGSIESYFGSKNFNGEDYLERFFDLEFFFPYPDIKVFCEHACEKYGIIGLLKSKHFIPNQQKNTELIEEEVDTFINLSVTLFDKMDFNLRQIEKFYSQIYTLLEFSPSFFTNPSLLIILIYLRYKNSGTYIKIKEGGLTLHELISSFEDIFSKIFDNSKEQEIKIFTRNIAFFILCYEAMVNRDGKHQIDNNNYRSFNFGCKIINEEDLKDYIEKYYNLFKYGDKKNNPDSYDPHYLNNWFFPLTEYTTRLDFYQSNF